MLKMQAGGFPIARQIHSKHFKIFAGSPECFQKLMELYEKGAVPPMAQPGPDGPRVLQMGFRDGTSPAPRCTEIPYKKILTKKSLQIPNLCYASEFDSDTRLFP